MFKSCACWSVLLVAALTLTAVGARAGDTASSDGVLQAVEEAYKAREFSRVLELAEPALAREKEVGTLIRLHYLTAKSIYTATAADINACREKGTIRKGDLRTDQADAMKKAITHFQAVYDLDPTNAVAPESLFMTGRILDYGCLNHFQEAVVQYDICRSKYPDDQYGRMAEDRYQKLKPRLETGSHGHGGS